MIGNKKILAVVLARAGSKGIPGKNYRDLCGKPLFIWSMLAGLKSKYVDTIVLSSNCEKCEKKHIEWVKTLSKKQQERVIFWLRPEELSTDTSKNELALIHALKACENGYGLKHSIVVNLQPTSPCRFSELLDGCLKEYDNGNYKSLFTAKKYTPFFWQKTNSKWKYITGKDCCDRPMRQEIFEDDKNSDFLMHDNGNIYIVDSKVLLKTECRISDNHAVYETTGILNFQIDEEYDFKLIETMIDSDDEINSPIDKNIPKKYKTIPENENIFFGYEYITKDGKYSRKPNDETEAEKMELGGKPIYSPKFNKNK